MFTELEEIEVVGTSGILPECLYEVNHYPNNGFSRLEHSLDINRVDIALSILKDHSFCNKNDDDLFEQLQKIEDFCQSVVDGSYSLTCGEM